MGAPNGPNGDAPCVAQRLQAVVEHFFSTRLAKSYLTIDIAIPLHKLGAQSYFKKYIDKVRGVMEHKKIRDRLSVFLDPETAQHCLDCDPKQFDAPNADQDTVCLRKAVDFRILWTRVNNNQIDAMPVDWVPSSEQVTVAKEKWLKSRS